MALIHTCYRITDVDRSVAFYEALGFKEVGRIPIRGSYRLPPLHFCGLQFVRLHEAASAEVHPPSDAQSAHQSR